MLAASSAECIVRRCLFTAAFALCCLTGAGQAIPLEFSLHRAMMHGGELLYEVSSPLVALVYECGRFRIDPGDRRVRHLHPQYFDYDASIKDVDMGMDAMHRAVPGGSLVAVRVVPVRMMDRDTTALHAPARVPPS